MFRMIDWNAHHAQIVDPQPSIWISCQQQINAAMTGMNSQCLQIQFQWWVELGVHLAFWREHKRGKLEQSTNTWFQRMEGEQWLLYASILLSYVSLSLGLCCWGERRSWSIQLERIAERVSEYFLNGTSAHTARYYLVCVGSAKRYSWMSE